MILIKTSVTGACLLCSVVCAQIQAPEEGNKIIFGTPTSQDAEKGSVESPAERKQRLIDLGVVPSPTPVPLGNDLSQISKQALGKQVNTAPSEREPQQLGFELNFGPWYAVKQPAKNSISGDFSHGVKSYYLHTKLSANWTGFVGLSAVYYNGKIYQQIMNVYGQESKIFVPYTASEYGGFYLFSSNMDCSPTWCSWFEHDLGFYPLRLIKSRYSYITEPKFRSEASTHRRFSYQSFTYQTSWQHLFYYVFGGGIFTSVSSAPAGQVRVRYGLSLRLVSFESLKGE